MRLKKKEGEEDGKMMKDGGRDDWKKRKYGERVGREEDEGCKEEEDWKRMKIRGRG